MRRSTPRAPTSPRSSASAWRPSSASHVVDPRCLDLGGRGQSGGLGRAMPARPDAARAHSSSHCACETCRWSSPDGGRLPLHCRRRALSQQTFNQTSYAGRKVSSTIESAPLRQELAVLASIARTKTASASYRWPCANRRIGSPLAASCALWIWVGPCETDAGQF